MKAKIFFSVLLVGLFSSCDPASQIRYSVVNKTSSILNLTVNPPSGKGLGASYDLKPNDEVTIFADKTLGYASDIIKYNSMDSDFLNCLTLTKDSIPLTINIQNTSTWISENIGDTLAMYKLIIKSDFTKEP
jgi:hypothetical protein